MELKSYSHQGKNANLVKNLVTTILQRTQQGNIKIGMTTEILQGKMDNTWERLVLRVSSHFLDWLLSPTCPSCLQIFSWPT